MHLERFIASRGGWRNAESTVDYASLVCLGNTAVIRNSVRAEWLCAAGCPFKWAPRSDLFLVSSQETACSRSNDTDLAALLVARSENICLAMKVSFVLSWWIMYACNVSTFFIIRACWITIHSDLLLLESMNPSNLSSTTIDEVLLMKRFYFTLSRNATHPCIIQSWLELFLLLLHVFARTSLETPLEITYKILTVIFY